MSIRDTAIGDEGASADISDTPNHPEPHIVEHDISRDFPDVHLLDVDLRSLSFTKEEGNLDLPEPHSQESSKAKERELLLAMGMGVSLSVSRFTTGANTGFYLVVDLDAKSIWSSLRVGPYASIGMPGGVTQRAPGGFGFNALFGPNLTVGMGNSANGFFGPANQLNVNGPGVVIGIVKTPDYKSVQISGGGGVGISIERTSTISGGEVDSYDLQRCYFELQQYIIKQ